MPEVPSHSPHTVLGQDGKKDSSDFSALTFSLSKQREVSEEETSVLRGVVVGNKEDSEEDAYDFGGDRAIEPGSLHKL